MKSFFSDAIEIAQNADLGCTECKKDFKEKQNDQDFIRSDAKRERESLQSLFDENNRPEATFLQSCLV